MFIFMPMFIILMAPVTEAMPQTLLARIPVAKALKKLKTQENRIVLAGKFTLLNSMTYLEQRAIRSHTLGDYLRRARAFVAWCLQNQISWSNAPSFDLAVSLYLDNQYWEGIASETGRHIVAAIKWFMVEVSRLGEHSLPRATRALKGWAFAAPGLQRLPLPLEALGLIIDLWLSQGLVHMALRAYLSFVCYLRPRESDLTAFQFVAPNLTTPTWSLLLSPQETEIPGKTNIFDETVTIDREPWIANFIEILVKHRQGESMSSVWDHRHVDFVQAFKTALEYWKLQFLGATLYSLRHLGASWDFLHKARPLNEIKKRGRWATDQSLRRYAKEARLQKQTGKIPERLARFGLSVIANLPLLLQGGQNIVLPEP